MRTIVDADAIVTASPAPAARLLPVTMRGPDTPPAAATFAHVLWRLAAARMSAGNRVALLRDGPATYDAMLDLIFAARRTVDLESYIVHPDAVGREFGDALKDATRRGVRVRLLTDWIGSRSIGRRFTRELREGGIDIAVFRPPTLVHPWRFLMPRDHRKLLVVDGESGVIGGIGIGREWSEGLNDAGRASRNRWRDTAVRIAGPAGEDMARSFDQMWRRVRSATAAAPAPELVLDGPTPFVAPALHDGMAAPALVGLLDGDPWRFRTARAFHFQTLIARRTLWIADAYFMPSLAEVEALEGAARDGVDVRLLVPSRNDHRWMLTLTRRYYRRLLSGGVRVWEWRGPMMHAKTTVSDGHLTRVGSTDFNPLGLALNYELDAVIEDAGLGAAAEAMFLDDLSQSREIRRADRAHEEDRSAAAPARSA